MAEKDIGHIIYLLESTKQALISNNSLKLNSLSNQTIHSICESQDAISISVAVIIYSLSKLIERKENLKIKNWDLFVKRLNSIIDLTIKALKENNERQYKNYLLKIISSIESISISLKPHVKEILRKACINKASKVYEHGISMEQTSKLLGVTQWELSEYAGQKLPETNLNITQDVKKRAKLALMFVS